MYCYRADYEETGSLFYRLYGILFIFNHRMCSAVYFRVFSPTAAIFVMRRNKIPLSVMKIEKK